MTTPLPPRGMRDFLPQDTALRHTLIQKILALFQAHGFREIQTPALESLEVLSQGGGQTSKLTFQVLKRGEKLRKALETKASLADLGLRFDLTVPLVRYYATHRAVLPAVFKALQIAPVWRAERPQKGRFRQFLQCDIDIIGGPSPLAEIDLLTTALKAYEALGFQQLTVELNHRKFLEHMLSTLGCPEQLQGAVCVILDKRDKYSSAQLLEDLEATTRNPAFCQKIKKLLEEESTKWWSPFLTNDPIRKLVAELLEIKDALKRSCHHVVFSPTLVRGMGYYTGAMFEVRQATSSPLSLGGGGRYDKMIHSLTGAPIPACGFSIGFERLVQMIEEENLLPKEEEPSTIACLLPACDVPWALVERQVNTLRRSYQRVSLLPVEKRLEKQLKRLKKEGFKGYCLLDEQARFLPVEEFHD